MTRPTYRNMGDHTEAVAIDFDPAVISYRQILDQIWNSHDATRNYGGVQYRHVIWYLNDEQKQQIDQSRDAISKRLDLPISKIVTDIEPAVEFTYAEDYHQKYSLRAQRDLIADLEGLFDDYIAFTDSATMSRLNGWFGERQTNRVDQFRDQIVEWELPDLINQRLITLL